MSQNSAVQKPAIQGAGLLMKACDILDLVGEAPGQWTVSALVAETGLSRSTLYRIVSALVTRGFLRNGADGQSLLLGFHYLDLAQNVGAGQDLAALAADELRRLREMTGETAYLAALAGNQMVSLAKSVGAHENASTAAMGKAKPVYATSQGKAVLAFLPERQAEQIMATLAFQAITPFTLTDISSLKRNLTLVRQRGFAIDDQENIAGTRCIGVPVLDEKGVPVAAISVSGPIYRMTPERVEQLAPELIAAGRRLGLMVQSQTAKTARPARNDVTATGPAAFHADRPFWLPRENCLYWIDRLAPAVYVLPEGGGAETIARPPGPITHALPGRSGGLDLICENGWFNVTRDAGCVAIDRPIAGDEHALARGPAGSLWAARHLGGVTQIGRLSARDGFQPAWRVGHDITDMAFSEDGSSLFALSPHEGTIYALQTGREVPMVLSRIPRGSGIPTALTLDRRGRLWVALSDGWSVVRLDENGEIAEAVALPVPRPTGIAFGGNAGSTLYVTSERIGIARDILENAPLSGRLLMLAVKS
ncbi:IclR family transcriptional regulator C-terminal domain-containing protein [Martelella sp. HB161492]|uniref:IclR family transcriptional regulator domain-containing protein n=1 Tax=Martelella sp. HB161492 TaxID=2720726 RepID=UPI0015913B07|nr:IclR family transcriptional regulator C-terminal domain-containing protein [Martelella sp. HB161492]